jgi:hypothetical protein
MLLLYWGYFLAIGLLIYLYDLATTHLAIKLDSRVATHLFTLIVGHWRASTPGKQ